MKKLFAMFAAVALSISLAALAIAAEEKKAAPSAASSKAESAKKDDQKSEPAKKDAVKRAKPKFVTGSIMELDAKAGTFSVKGRKGTVKLKAGEKVKLDAYNVGDKVTVAYDADGVASKIIIPAKKAAQKKDGAKEEPKKEEKKAEPKKEAPAAPAKK